MSIWSGGTTAATPCPSLWVYGEADGGALRVRMLEAENCLLPAPLLLAGAPVGGSRGAAFSDWYELMTGSLASLIRATAWSNYQTTTLVEYVWRDYMGPEAEPPEVLANRVADAIEAAGREDSGTQFTGRELWYLPAEVLIATAIELALAAGAGGDGATAAQVLDVLERYAPEFSLAGARSAARALGIGIADDPPVAAVGEPEEFVRGFLRLDELPARWIGATATVRQTAEGLLIAAADGRELLDRCRRAEFTKGSLALWVQLRAAEDCAPSLELILVAQAASQADAGWDGEPDEWYGLEDAQRLRVYDWEYEIVVNRMPAALTARAPQWRARRIVEAVFAGLFGSAESAPTVEFPADAESSGYDSEIHRISFARAELSAWVVLHELAHALIAAADRDRYEQLEGHGPEFAAQLAYLWERYMPGFDAREARAAGALHGVEFGEPPLRARAGVGGIRTVLEALGCAAPSDCAPAE